MIINRDPWVLLVLGGVPAAITRSITQTDERAYLTVFAPQQYSPFEKLPATDDKSVFASLYALLDSYVNKGVLEGPGGENHPAVYHRFEYRATVLTPSELLKILERDGASVQVTAVRFTRRLEVEAVERQTAEEQLRQEAGKVAGLWINDETKFEFPEILKKPKPMTEAERAALHAEIEELLKPGIVDKVVGKIFGFARAVSRAFRR